MTSRGRVGRDLRIGRDPSVGAVLLLVLAAGCSAGPSPSTLPSPTVSPEASPSAAASAAASRVPSASPSPTPEPTLSLDLPEEQDERAVAVSVDPALDDAGGEIRVTVTSLAETRVDELVLRWPVELDASLFLAPFVPSDDRIRDGGDPLVQPWTKWVIGPGERGEPAGTISLGYGPLLPGATLEIILFAARRAPGPVAFDLQVLAGNDLLELDGGDPAELRVEIP